MGMLEIQCARCGTIYYAGEEHLGRMLKCSNPKCGDSVPIERAGHKNSKQTIELKGSSKDKVVSSGVSLNPTRWFEAPKAQLAGMMVLGVVVLILGWFYFNSDPNVEIFDAVAQHDADSSRQHNPKPVLLQPREYEETKPALPSARSLDGLERQNPRSINSLPTGTLLGTERYNRGRGKLTVSNGTSEDSVVAVVVSSTGRLARKVYIAAGSQYSLDKFDEGAYRVLFSLGTDWNPQSNSFNENASYQEFGKILFFSERQLEDGIEYSHHTITLNAVPDGNVHRVDIDAAKFRDALLQQ